MIASSKETWEVLLKKNITISAEYLPSALSKEADWDSSDWKLRPLIFQRIKSRFSHPQIDMLASRLCHQLENYLPWRPDPQSKGVDAMQQNWPVQLVHILYAFPPFSLIPSLKQDSTGPSSYNDTCSDNMAERTLVSQTSTFYFRFF